MLISQAKGRELVLRGVALHQQDATDQEGSQKRSPYQTHLEDKLIKDMFNDWYDKIKELHFI